MGPSVLPQQTAFGHSGQRGLDLLQKKKNKKKTLVMVLEEGVLIVVCVVFFECFFFCLIWSARPNASGSPAAATRPQRAAEEVAVCLLN